MAVRFLPYDVLPLRMATEPQPDSLFGLVEVGSSRTPSLILCKFVDTAEASLQRKGISTGLFLMRQLHLWFQFTVSVSWLGSLE